MKRVKLPCFFDEAYIDNITFYPYTETEHYEYIAADTETKLYFNGELLTEEAAYEIYRDNGQAYFKTHVEVRAYAYTMSTGKGFACFLNIEDFLTACSMLNVKTVFWYNARFDFSIFDYYFLTHDWKDATFRIAENNGRYKHLADKTYTSLNGEFGQRYQMQVWKSYVNRNSKTVVHKFKMTDICNISGGGLAKNLKDWDIKDENGNDIRKLEMDYVESDFETDMPYMIADVKGLYYLAETINRSLKEITEYSLLDGDYITAGGLAIKTLLKFMYGDKDIRTNRKKFKKEFPMKAEKDKLLRDMHLYLGGKCLVNPHKKGVLQAKVYKYDVNSMYPAQMRDMLYPYGTPLYSKEYIKNSYIKVLCISAVCGIIKANKIPIFQDFESKEFEETLYIPEPFYIWEEELEELENWYDMSYHIEEVFYYKGKTCKGAQDFVDTFYDIKKNARGAVRNGAKLELNSSYGKLAQKIERVQVQYTLSADGYVHLSQLETKTDTKSMLSVLVGSRITALARVSLMRYIRLICKENVKDNFIYCDTDSVHALTEYPDTDAKELGKMKNEGTYKYAIYLAPKSYLMQDYDGHYEVHCKGVNTKVVEKEVTGKNILEALDIFTANRTFKTLCGVNCRGGKALVYVDKVILNDKNYTCDKTCINNEDIFFEIGE